MKPSLTAQNIDHSMKNPPAPALLTHALAAATLNTVIALGITAFGDREFGTTLVYSQSIGLTIWALIDLGRHWLITDPKNQTQRLIWIVPVSVMVGYLVGTMLADALLGHDMMSEWAAQPRSALGFLSLSLLVGVGCSYYFMSRARLASVRADIACAHAKAEAAQRQAAQSKLKLLQSQLEPHMLFNTLANLRALIGAEPARAQGMLDHLVAYLRATLDASRANTHSLQTEFDRLQDYLELMAVRMGPRLQFKLDLPPALAEQQIPPLLLQALVENSIKHGLEPKVEGGSITISARLNGANLRLEVKDSGIGTGEDLNQPPVSDSGFGRVQVRERLQTIFGDQATFELTSSHETGTLACITYPSS